jgi:acyl-CoA synthetase (AMP-forming)/AMP-acid ligase II
VFGDTGVGVPFSKLLASTANLPEIAIDPAADVAVIPSSSGTTGPPKGVVYTHAGLVANGAVSAGSGSSRETDIFAGTSPFAHVAGMGLLMLSGPAVGLTTVLIPKFEATAYLRTLREYQITYAAMSPPMLIALLNLPLDTMADFSAVRRVTSGAAPFSPELERAFNARFGVVVRQAYGMTEICPTHLMLNEAPAGKDGSVGQCLSNTECMIVSLANSAPLGPDEVGEVWVRGPQRMREYLNNPEATAATIDAEGWVHTGDVGRIDRDGYLFIVDRLKELIKYKGYQVAPAELEALLLTHPDVADAAVVRYPDAEAGEIPKAFVVLRSAISAAELMAYVAARVAPYKKVRRVEFIDAIPKSPSGKILRRELIERDRALASTLN